MQVSITIDRVELFDEQAWEKSLIKGMDKLTADTNQDFHATTSSWENHDPDFKVQRAKRVGSSFISKVETDDPLYVGLNNGMPAHDITAKNFPTLVYQSRYHPKTQPGFIGSGRSYSSGQYIRKVSVRHSGTEPRNWDLAIAAKHKDDLDPIALEAVEAGTK